MLTSFVICINPWLRKMKVARVLGWPGPCNPPFLKIVRQRCGIPRLVLDSPLLEKVEEPGLEEHVSWGGPGPPAR